MTPTELPPFQEFNKIPRLSREIIITEKIDGTNVQIYISDDLSIVQAGSRNRWIYPEKSKDNAGFAVWVKTNEDEIRKLGPGIHYGEWWGAGIQRTYGLKEKRFSLFGVHRWSPIWKEEGDQVPPAGIGVVPILYQGVFDTGMINGVMLGLQAGGSVAAPGFMNPEGIVIYHTASKQLFKKTIEGDETFKGSFTK